MLHDMVVQPEQFLGNIRRYSNSLTTTMVFGWRTPMNNDKKLIQLFEGFSEFADLNQTGIAALLDSFPMLRKLPEFFLPLQQKARDLHQKEKALYLSHWLKAKEEVAITDQEIKRQLHIDPYDSRFNIKSFKIKEIKSTALGI